MRLSATRSIVKLSCLLLSLSFLSGCVNLEEVRDFSRQSAAITASTQALEYEQGWGGRKADLTRIAESYPVINPREEFKAREIDVPNADVKDLKPEQKKAIESVQEVLSKYMTQLAALAEDEVVSVDKEVDKLVENLNNFPGSTQDKASKEQGNAAYGAIVKLIKLPQDAWRQYKLKQLIVENDTNIRLLTDLLAEKTKNIAHRIQAEGIETDEWYTRIEQDYPARNFIDAVGGNELRIARFDESKAKARAALAAADAIKKFGTIHHEMAVKLTTFNSDSTRDLIANVKVAKEEVEKARKQYQAAFPD